jgi:hypothetical protein
VKVLIAATKLPYKTWVNWYKNSLHEVKKKCIKRWGFKEAMKSLGKIEENLHDTHSQEVGILYHGTRLWVLYSIAISLLENKHNSKVAGPIGKDKMAELIQRNFWWPKMNEIII